ncbi:MAG: PadR family transcriptional regulator [Gemmatimonadota bacterium]
MSDSAKPSRNDLVQGTLEMMILKTLTVAPAHGYAVAQHIGRVSGEVFRVEQGSLYPALERLQLKGWVTSKWGVTPTGRRARYYKITAAGRKQLGEEVSQYDRLALGIARVLGRA